MKSWNFSQLWNESLDVDKQRELKPRDYAWASELGRGFYDRYWKMQGRKPTTPPGARARRKFEAGSLTEWVMQQVLVRAGVLKGVQLPLKDDTGAIPVSGRCDFMAGGKVQDVNLEDIGLPESFAQVAQTTIDKLKEQYPDGLREQGLEIKSCAGMMFERYLLAPSVNHALQAFFYAKTTNKPYLLVYVSRDDLRVCQWVILPKSAKWQKLYDKDLEIMAQVMDTSNKAKKAKQSEDFHEKLREPLLTWNGDKFSKNWEIEYSAYLTDYGFSRPDEYSEPASSVARRLNNIVKKIKEGKPIDGKVNLKTLAECYEFYPKAADIIKELK